ncbi:LolA family protein [Yinghuangia sp. YIM S09857]|uniref:LolA family protein n=1 Tax=Yinghuangia sp. YIM S09857 TaxID=3436929 RepID=UPI003F53B940
MPAALRTAGKVALPLGIAALAAGAIAYGPSAFADDSDPNLPNLTAEEVVAKIAGAKPEALSGSVRITTDLGIPNLGGNRDADPTALLSGTHTVRVAVDGPDRQRIGIQAELAEYNVIHNGRDLWTYDSRSNKATHTTLPEGAASDPKSTPPTGLAVTPQEAAKQLLAVVGPGTSVTVAGTDKVAGRDAHQLRIAPAQPGSLIGGATVSVDAETGVPLRVVVDTAKGGKPAIDVGFTDVSFKKPSADTFDFKPPSGAKVEETNKKDAPDAKNSAGALGLDLGKLTGGFTGADPKVHGEGWSTVVEMRLPDGLSLPGADKPKDDGDKGDKDGGDGDKGKGDDLAAELLGKLGTKVDGGTLFGTRLVNALVTDDGRVFVGAVDGPTLQKAAAESTAAR